MSYIEGYLWRWVQVNLWRDTWGFQFNSIFLRDTREGQGRILSDTEREASTIFPNSEGTLTKIWCPHELFYTVYMDNIDFSGLPVVEGYNTCVYRFGYLFKI